MEVVISTTPEQAGKLAADAFEELVHRRPDAVLGVATGSSPLMIYEELGRRVAQGSLSLAKARAFMLDEYVGRWRLDEVVTSVGKPSQLYYLVRLPRRTLPDVLPTAVRAKAGPMIVPANVGRGASRASQYRIWPEGSPRGQASFLRFGNRSGIPGCRS